MEYFDFEEQEKPLPNENSPHVAQLMLEKGVMPLSEILCYCDSEAFFYSEIEKLMQFRRFYRKNYNMWENANNVEEQIPDDPEVDDFILNFSEGEVIPELMDCEIETLLFMENVMSPTDILQYCIDGVFLITEFEKLMHFLQEYKIELNDPNEQAARDLYDYLNKTFKERFCIESYKTDAVQPNSTENH